MEQISYPYWEVILVFRDCVLSLITASPCGSSIQFISLRCSWVSVGLRTTSKVLSFMQNEETLKKYVLLLSMVWRKTGGEINSPNHSSSRY
jgi:hypothetical protein